MKVSANTLVGPGGAFQPWTSTVLQPVNSANPTYGGPYWNNFSGDGAKANIGWCLAGTGGCAISSPPGAISYYGTSTGAAVQNMAFVNPGSPVSISLLGTFTNQKGNGNGTDYFGWYAINADGSIGAMTQLWSSTAPVNTTSAIITPNGSYGLYLESVQGNGAASYFWFMNDNDNYAGGPNKNPVDNNQHFAVFSATPGIYYVGMEEGNYALGTADGDFNDMIVKVTSVPEPAALTLLGAAVLLAVRRKR